MSSLLRFLFSSSQSCFFPFIPFLGHPFFLSFILRFDLSIFLDIYYALLSLRSVTRGIKVLEVGIVYIDLQPLLDAPSLHLLFVVKRVIVIIIIIKFLEFLNNLFKIVA